MYFKITSAGSLTATRTCTIAPNTVSRVMFIENATTGSQSIAISQGSGASVTILTGKTAVVYLDGAGAGAAVVDAMSGVDPGVTDTLTEVLVAGNTSGGTNIELSTTDKVQFRDTGIYINSSVDGQLDIVADTEIQIATTTVDINGAVDVSGTLGVTGVATLASLVATTADINAGTIDGTVIGGSTAAAITGTTITGTSFVSSGDMTFGDDDKAIFGAGSDLQIYHDGSNSYVKDNGVGDLIIQAYDDIKFQQSTDNADLVTINTGGNVGIGTSSPVTLKSATTLQVSGNAKLGDDNGRGLLSLGDIASTGANAGIWRGAAGAYAGTGNYLNLGGYDGITFTTGAADISAQTERMRIDASGNVGIGTPSPSEDLHVSGTGDRNIAVESTNTGAGANAGIKILAADGGDFLWQTGNATGNALRLYDLNATAERMRIDASGNLLVGKTSVGSSFIGSELNPTGYVVTSCVSDFCGYFNRTTTDGGILQFRKDNASVGSIGSTGGNLQFMSGSVGVGVGGDNLYPTNGSGNSTDAALDIGDSTARFKDLYLSGGVYLGGTGAANHLEDYEEGTWTPSYSGAGSPSYLTQYGRYTKIGRVVYCTIAIRATSVSGASNIEIAGLPFTPADAGDTSQRSTYSPFLGGHCSGLSESTGRFRTTATTNLAGVKSSLGTTFMTAAEFSSGGSPEITGDFWYYTS
jgi:hypothetical protein